MRVDDDVDRQALMELLARTAEDGRPRVFCIYGTYRNDPSELILGWGLEFSQDDGAIYRGAGERNLHSCSTAEQLFAFHSRIGDVELKWLDE